MKAVRKEFMPIAGIVNGLLRMYTQQRASPAAQVEEVWRTVVGEELAAVSHVRAVSPDVVHIEVVGAAARAEIESFFRDRFLWALKDAGVAGARRVQFHVADA
jgi:hypothetical protein